MTRESNNPIAKNMKPSKRYGLIKKYGVRFLVLLFWLLLWEFLYRVINNEVFLTSPMTVIQTLGELLMQSNFWQTIGFSFARIVMGFIIAIFLGTLLGVLAYNLWIIEELISPIFIVMKAVPVASFVILSLLWISTKNLSILISFLMVVPIIYTNLLQGLRNTDKKLLEMAKVFHISPMRKIKAIYIPSVLPYFMSAIKVGLGFCWKAGIAAEVIGIPNGSIGERLYEAKLYLMTEELFAWTAVIVIISMIFEKIVILLIDCLHGTYDARVKGSGDTY